jgi:Tol biopolymer transport system component
MRTRARTLRCLKGIGGAMLLWSLNALGAPGDTELISIRNPAINVPTSPNDDSFDPVISSDGRVVAFTSLATDLVSGSTQRHYEVYGFDRQTGAIELASQNTNGTRGDSDSFIGNISGSGRYVAFVSSATNLVANDTNNAPDVFVRDFQTHTTTRVSVNSNGVEGNAISDYPSISGDGRHVAFISRATNLTDDNIGNGLYAIFLRDLQAGTVVRVSFVPEGVSDYNFHWPTVSGDASRVAYQLEGYIYDEQGQPRSISRAYVWNRSTGTVAEVSVTPAGSPSPSDSAFPVMSANGRYVTFHGAAYSANGDPVFGLVVRDLQSNSTVLANIGPNGAPIPADTEQSISANGRFVAFAFYDPGQPVNDTNGMVFVRDLLAGTTSRVSLKSNGERGDGMSSTPSLSGDGRYVAFASFGALTAGDANLHQDIFMKDRQDSSTDLISISKVASRTPPGRSGESSESSASYDGRFVAFVSSAAVLVPNDTNTANDVFIRDRQLGTTARASVGSGGTEANGDSSNPSLSGNGRFIAFASVARNLVPNDSNGVQDVFVRDTQTGNTTRVSIGTNGAQGTLESRDPAISADGRFVVFTSDASNLVSNDTNNVSDVFIRDRQTGATTRLSVTSAGAQGNQGSFGASISADGRFVTFSSRANNLAAGDTNNVNDIFLRDRQKNTTRRVSISTNGSELLGENSNASISENGRFIVFNHEDNGPDVLVRDLTLETTVSATAEAIGGPARAWLSNGAAISANGRYIVFHTIDDYLEHDGNGALDVLVYDRFLGFARLVSATPGLVLGNGDSLSATLSANGRLVVYTTHAANLTADDHNGAPDVLAHEPKPGTVIRINAGGAGFTDTLGRFWQADRGFNTGEGSHFTAPVAGTLDDALYQDERWDQAAAPELQYQFAVPNGNYDVRLFFAENYVPNFGVGKRVFGIEVEGRTLSSGFDVFAAGGARTAVLIGSTFDVTDEHLDILFRHKVQNPIVNAIAIVERQAYTAP